jgi:uncharacterized protein YpiB (UPF0302 family)
MPKHVSPQDKKAFIEWVLQNLQFNRKEIQWIFKHLLSNQLDLNKVHFVENKNNYKNKKVVEINQSSVVGKPFEFTKTGITRYDPDQAYHDLRVNSYEDVYFVLHFRNKNQNAKYLNVLEDHKIINRDRIEDDKKNAKFFLEYCMKQFKIKQLELELDKALIERDEEKFKRLCRELEEARN